MHYFQIFFYIFYYKNSKERINFSKRSYIKENELENRDICYTISHGREFGNVGKEKLGKLGKDIIEKFIIDNKKREKLLFEKEKNLNEDKRSKPNLKLNKWKFNDHICRDFDQFKIDDVYFFKKETKPEYLIKAPFKIPKRDGDYFDKPKVV